MKKEVNVPMVRLLGIEVRTRTAAGQNTEIAMIPCNLPLLSSTSEGQSRVNLTLHTSEGDLNLIEMAIPTAKAADFTPSAKLAVECLLEELATIKPIAHNPKETEVTEAPIDVNAAARA